MATTLFKHVTKGSKFSKCWRQPIGLTALWSHSHGKSLSIAWNDTYFAAQMCRTIVNESTDHRRQFGIYAANDAESKAATDTSFYLDNSVVAHRTDMVLPPDENTRKQALASAIFDRHRPSNWTKKHSLPNTITLLRYCVNISKRRSCCLIVGKQRHIFGIVSALAEAARACAIARVPSARPYQSVIIDSII